MKILINANGILSRSSGYVSVYSLYTYAVCMYHCYYYIFLWLLLLTNGAATAAAAISVNFNYTPYSSVAHSRVSVYDLNRKFPMRVNMDEYVYIM